MKLAYPLENLTANAHYKFNEDGEAGFYPIGVSRYWHGGVNFFFKGTYEKLGDTPICAIADGTVVAYRVTDGYCKFEKKFQEGKSKVFYIDGNCSNNFVLLKHKFTTPKGQPVEFYSLYHHLLPFGLYKAAYDKGKLSIFNRWATYVKTSEDGKGLNLRDASGEIIGLIPQGAYVKKVERPTEDYKGPANRSKYVAITSAFGNGFVYFEGKFQERLDHTYACITKEDSPGDNHLGLNVRAMPVTCSQVLEVLKKGTEVTFVHPEQVVNQQGIFAEKYVQLAGDPASPLRYLYAGASQLERKRIVDPKLSQKDEVQVPSEEIKVKAGEVIGWPGYDGNTPNKTTHIEVFTQNKALNTSEGFWNNGKGDGPLDGVYGVKQGAGFHQQVFARRMEKTLPANTVLQLAEPITRVGKTPMKDYRPIKTLKTVEGWIRGQELGMATEISRGDRVPLTRSIDKVWMEKPGATTTEATRTVYVGLKPTYREKPVTVTVLDFNMESLEHWYFKIRYTVPDQDYVSCDGWIKKAGNLEGHTYIEGVKQCRYRALKEIDEIYGTSPELIEFETRYTAAGPFCTTADFYILKQDCLRQTDKDGKNWIGIPASPLEQGDNWFDKEATPTVREYLWIEETDPNLSQENLYNWQKFFTRAKEGSFIKDGFCDPAKLAILFPGKDRNWVLEQENVKEAITDTYMKGPIRHLVAEQLSEWYYSAAACQTKYEKRLKKPEGWMEADMYTAFQETVEKASFLHQIPEFKEGEKYWNFHPIAFVQHLKRIFSKSYYAEYTEDSLTIYTLEGSTTYEANEYGMVKFPESGRGISRYGQEYIDTYTVPGKDTGAYGDNWANPKFAAAVYNAIQEYLDSNSNYENDIPFSYNDFSAYLPTVKLGHQLHTAGTDVDIRYMDSNGKPTSDHSQADKTRCAKLVEKLKEKGCTRIYSHNHCIDGTTHAKGHENHIHAGWSP